MSNKACRRYLISGKVQGVWFRGSTQQQALQLGVTGWVRNLPDGRVEALICGTEEQLEEMGDWLQHGPPGARVDSVTTTVEDYVLEDEFNIRY